MYQKPCRLTSVDKFYGGAPSIPQQDPAKVFAAIRQNLGPLVQKQIGLARQYGPVAAQRDIAQSREFAPQYAQLGLDLTNQFGPQYAQAGYDISKQFAPQYEQLNLGQLQSAIAGSPLLAEANQQVLGRLQQKGQLSPQEAYQTTQGTLGAFAGRNNVFNQAEAQSFLNRDALVRQRQNEALQQAQSLQATNLGTLQGIGGVAQMPNLAGYAQAPNLAAYGAPGQSLAPLQATLGATSGTLGTVAPIVSDIFGSNQSAAANQAIGGANKTSGIAGGALSAIGSIAAAY
jgi:hypothetical protein